ncbi:hypothetical protein DY000_02001053 [Brassica cretica]|uniref:DC1 domain-containing protein n=1 Tax=Brassica cretica TaxID=69181 RepID=A0ABQ7BSZ7_BRACR|nr:hypothetical protein DY000_02001053 [Brassica cretica]
MSLDDMIAKIKAVKKYNDVQLDGKPMKIDIVGNNLQTASWPLGTIYGGYYCNDPNCYAWFFHKKCAEAPLQINHPSHPQHLLLLTKQLGVGVCELCGESIRTPFYRCSTTTCEFKVNLNCGMKPPPSGIEHPLCHDHPLVLLKKGKEKFRCECAFLTHGECIDLPRIISINRHEHRISFTPHLGAGYSKCGVCRKSLNQYHGAYSCSVCPKYATHCKCALRSDLWDRVDLEGIPNHDAKYIAPFKVVGDDLIIHFSHEKHPLKFYKNRILYDKWLQCEACMYPLVFESIYGCNL